MAYDFTDKLVLDLVQRTHQPTELVVKSADGKPATLFLVCDLDGDPWPCAPVVEMRAYLDQRRKSDQASAEAASQQERADGGRIFG